MGLFWSMKNNPKSINRLQVADPSVPLVYEFKVYNSHACDFIDDNLICKTKANRHILAKGVSIKFIKSGRIRGILFCPPGTGLFPAVITLYGVTKKRLPIQDSSAIFANNGYISLALAYFNVDNLPKVYNNLDIEYFEEALIFLQNLSIVDKKSIGLCGICKGGGIVLAMASFLPQIRSVFCINSCLHSIGVDTAYHGATIPKLIFNENNYKISEYGTILVNTVYSGMSINHPSKGFFPFTQSKCTILFIVGLDDSSVNVDHYFKILNHQKSSAKPGSINVLTYDGLGHLVDSPYMPVSFCAFHVQYSDLLIEYDGRNIHLHALSQIKVWKDIIDFFDNSLKFPICSL